jgi:hypothetical protein
MLAWLGILIKSNNSVILNAVENMIPQRLDSRLWDSDEYVLDRKIDENGIEFVHVSIFFLDFNERANLRSALGGINGFIHTALPGSFIKETKCWHNELLPNNSPIKGDELEFEEAVV